MSEYSNNQYYFVDNEDQQPPNYHEMWQGNSVFLENQPLSEKIMLMPQPGQSKNEEKMQDNRATRDSEPTQHHRMTRTIEISSAKRQAFIQIVKGTKNQTVELNTNYKTIIVNFLKDLIVLNQLNELEFQTVNSFRDKVPSFEALLNAFFSAEGSQSLRKRICEYLGSTLVVRQILKSRANEVNKVRMLKFLEILRINLKGNGQVIKWKAQRNRRSKY